jgi:hypothetical protein
MQERSKAQRSDPSKREGGGVSGEESEGEFEGEWRERSGGGDGGKDERAARAGSDCRFRRIKREADTN